MKLRLFYNPNSKDVYNCGNTSHVSYYHNKKLSNTFDFYIRGIIDGNTLYLRAYYPYGDIVYISHNEIMRKSLDLLTLYKADIIEAVKDNLNITIDKTILNVSNEDLKGYLKSQYV